MITIAITINYSHRLQRVVDVMVQPLTPLHNLQLTWCMIMIMPWCMIKWKWDIPNIFTISHIWEILWYVVNVISTIWERRGSGDTVILDKSELDTRRGFGFLWLSLILFEIFLMIIYILHNTITILTENHYRVFPDPPLLACWSRSHIPVEANAEVVWERRQAKVSGWIFFRGEYL